MTLRFAPKAKLFNQHVYMLVTEDFLKPDLPYLCSRNLEVIYFVPGIKNIISALQGDTSEIAKFGIVLGDDDFQKFVPSKLDKGKSIYGTAIASSDNIEGGCIIFKTDKYVIIVTYEEDEERSFTAAANVTSQVAKHLMELGL